MRKAHPIENQNVKRLHQNILAGASIVPSVSDQLHLFNDDPADAHPSSMFIASALGSSPL
jgi:hypothetical protein